MKTHLIIVFIALIVPFISIAQPEKGKIELSFQGNYSRSKFTTDPDLSYYNSTEDITRGLFYLRGGYYLTDQFSVDPEIFWNFSNSGVASKSLAISLNGTFHSIIKNMLFLFGTAGAGLTDAIPDTWIEHEENKYDILMLNFGLGLKYFVSESVALRTEYRYQSYRYNEDFIYFGKPTTATFKTSVNNFLVGFSVFL